MNAAHFLWTSTPDIDTQLDISNIFSTMQHWMLPVIYEHPQQTMRCSLDIVPKRQVSQLFLHLEYHPQDPPSWAIKHIQQTQISEPDGKPSLKQMTNYNGTACTDNHLTSGISFLYKTYKVLGQVSQATWWSSLVSCLILFSLQHCWHQCCHEWNNPAK